MEIKQRNEELVALYEKGGITYEKIGEKYGITRQRVEQIINNKIYLSGTIPTHKRKHLRILSGRRVREIVRLRDGHTCQECGKKWKEGEKKLDVHHLNGMCGKVEAEKDVIENIHNLITLCHKCHFNHAQHANNLRKKKEGWEKEANRVKDYQERGLTIAEIARLMGKHRTQIYRLIEYKKKAWHDTTVS